MKQTNKNSVSQSETPAPHREGKLNALAVVALLLSVPLAPLAFVLAFVAKAQIKRTPQRGRGLATTAIIISTVTIVAVLSGVGYWVFISNMYKQPPVTIPPAPALKEYTSDGQIAVDKTNSFLKALSNNNYSQAYDLFSPELKAEYKDGVAGFQAEVVKSYARALDSWAIIKVDTNSTADKINVKGRATFDNLPNSGDFDLGFYKSSSGTFELYFWQLSAGQ